MVVKKFSLLILILISGVLLGQEAPKDSVMKIINLSEVQISEEGYENNNAFNFYKQNKLATTEDILSRIQGVNLIKRGAYGLEPSLRNYSGGQTNISIDGMRIYGACTDKMDPVSIYVEPNNLSGIQVAHGSSGSFNGSTVGGLINMKIKEPIILSSARPHGDFSQTYASVNNALFTTATLQQSYKKLTYRINGTYRKADDYAAGGGLIIPYSGFEKYNLGGSLLYKISEKQKIKTDYLGDWGKNIGYPALPMDVASAVANIVSLTHQLSFKNKWVSSNEIKVYYNAITHKMDDTHRPNVPMHMDMPGWTQTIGFFNELTSNENLKIRLDAHHVNSRADMVMYPKGEPVMYLQTLPENDLINGGLSLQYLRNFKYQQEITMTARGDFFTQMAVWGPGSKQWKVFNTDVTQSLINVLKNGNLSYSKRFYEKIMLQVTAGYSERIPSSNERYGFYLFNRQDQFDYIGNSLLKPEQSLQGEVSVRHKMQHVEYGITLFYHHIRNYIYAYKLLHVGQMTIGAQGTKTYRNIDYALSQGFETNIKAHFLQNFFFINNTKFVYAQTFLGHPLALIPPLKLQQALRYAYNLYQFQLEHDYAMAQNRINSDFGDKATPEYHLFNIRVSKNFRIKETVLQATLACENIFDTNYREHLDIGQIPRFGRNFIINTSFLF